MGQVISLVNQKGGVSKSTTSVHLAYWLITKKKQKILLIDADSQRSSSLWVEGMEETKIPVQPTGVDLRSASDAMRLVKQAQSVRGGLPKAVMFLSRAVKGTKLKDEAIALLNKNPGAILLDTVIHQKQAIADTSGQSATVWDLPGKPASESAAEYEKLFSEMLKQLP
jgi:chromosome partitioning protein